MSSFHYSFDAESISMTGATQQLDTICKKFGYTLRRAQQHDGEAYIEIESPCPEIAISFTGKDGFRIHFPYLARYTENEFSPLLMKISSAYSLLCALNRVDLSTLDPMF